MTLQGQQIHRKGPDRVDVSLPTFKPTRDEAEKTAIMLPPELFRAIVAAVAKVFKILDAIITAVEPVREMWARQASAMYKASSV